MLLWIFCAALAGLSALVIARPLFGSVKPSDAGPVDVYRAQLDELERERAAGDVSATAAEEARREIARRLLAADAAAEPLRAPVQGRSGVAIAGVGLAMVAAVGLYAWLGRPGLPGEPLAGRDMDAAMQSASLDDIAEVLFQRLAMDPGQPDGWELLARTYMRLGRHAEAAGAFAQAIALRGDSAPASLFSARGEALTLAAGGRVTDEARVAFAEALQRDPKDAPGRYYSAIAKAQAGDLEGARADLEALLADTPADAPYRALVEAKLGEIGVPTPKDDPAVQGMVANLAAKLEADPNNLDGWLLLITSYVKLDEPEKALAALATARATFKDDAAALEAIAAKARELGLEP